jgi:hypothetical protein
VVSAVKASVGGTFYGFGAALFSIFGIILFVRDSGATLAAAGISLDEAGDILRTTTTTGKSAAAVANPDRTAVVISEATSSILDAAQVLNLAMVCIPVAAIVLVLVLFRREREPLSTSDTASTASNSGISDTSADH